MLLNERLQPRTLDRAELRVGYGEIEYVAALDLEGGPLS